MPRAFSSAAIARRLVAPQPRMRYVDLGLSRGFEADLVVDHAGLVLRYDHLFERVAPPA